MFFRNRRRVRNPSQTCFHQNLLRHQPRSSIVVFQARFQIPKTSPMRRRLRLRPRRAHGVGAGGQGPRATRFRHEGFQEGED